MRKLTTVPQATENRLDENEDRTIGFNNVELALIRSNFLWCLEVRI